MEDDAGLSGWASTLDAPPWERHNGGGSAPRMAAIYTSGSAVAGPAERPRREAPGGMKRELVWGRRR